MKTTTYTVKATAPNELPGAAPRPQDDAVRGGCFSGEKCPCGTASAYGRGNGESGCDQFGPAQPMG